MRFGILGAGAVGGYFGARLAEAGENVAFIARVTSGGNSELRACIESEHRDVCITNSLATDNASEVGHVDFILFAVKLFQTEDAAEFARPRTVPILACLLRPWNAPIHSRAFTDQKRF